LKRFYFQCKVDAIPIADFLPKLSHIHIQSSNIILALTGEFSKVNSGNISSDSIVDNPSHLNTLTFP
jgi:hypothetical protein